MKKRGIVLFTTLMLIMALLSVVMIFLNKTKQTHDAVGKEFALLQTNLVMANLVEYFHDIKFDEDTIFYGSGVPYGLDFGDSSVEIVIDSTHKYLNINTLVKFITKKDNPEYSKFVDFLYKYRVKDPELFIDILIDTVDPDKEELNSGSGSEIALKEPLFRNGNIYNQKHFDKIIEYYSLLYNDQEIYKVPFGEMFNFTAPSLDLNFASLNILKIVLDDANSQVLQTIAKHNEVYEKLEDIDFDEEYLKTILKGKFGHTITTVSKLISVSVKVQYKSQFRSHLTYLYDTEKKKLYDYSIDKIEYEGIE